MAEASLDGWERRSCTLEGTTREVFVRGDGPAVVVMHEIPGITTAVEAFGRRVADAGFFVAMPRLFGEVGRPFSHADSSREILRACVSKEFSVWAANRSSPITTWLRALCRQLHEERGGPGVGAIGMCLTGNFALSLMVDPWLMAPVLSQPSLPFAVTPGQRRGLAISADELAIIKGRCAADPGLKVIGMRFTPDPMVPKARFDRLRRELGERFEAIELPGSAANPDGPGIPHSVVTNHLIDEEGQPTRQALDRVLAFFAERLKPR